VTSINEALRQGDASLRLLEERYGPSRSALSRHLSHLEGGVAPPPDAPPGAAAATTLEPLPSVTTRLRTCEVCQHPELARLDVLLAASGPTPALTLAYGLASSQCTFHQQHRASEAASRARYAQEQARAQAAAVAAAAPPASPAPLPWEELMQLATLIHAQAEYGASAQSMLFTVRNLAKFVPQLVAAAAAACGQPCPVPAGLLLPRFRPGTDLPLHADWQTRGRDEASTL
jgi:hypothetical protein